MLPQAPEWIANFTLRYGIPLSNGELFAYTDWSYRSEVNFFLYESTEFTGKELLEGGLRVGYNWSEGKYEAAAFARNITDEVVAVGAIDFNNLTGFLIEPRIVGFTVQGALLRVGNAEGIMKANYPAAALLAVAMCVASCGGSNTSQYVDFACGGAGTISATRTPTCLRKVSPFPRSSPRWRVRRLTTRCSPICRRSQTQFRWHISGTPTEPRATATYLVTAGNSIGTASFGVRITVHGRFTVGGVVNGLTGTGLGAHQQWG